jgi:hypothetical protein
MGLTQKQAKKIYPEGFQTRVLFARQWENQDGFTQNQGQIAGLFVENLREYGPINQFHNRFTPKFGSLLGQR